MGWAARLNQTGKGLKVSTIKPSAPITNYKQKWCLVCRAATLHYDDKCANYHDKTTTIQY